MFVVFMWMGFPFFCLVSCFPVSMGFFFGGGGLWGLLRLGGGEMCGGLLGLEALVLDSVWWLAGVWCGGHVRFLPKDRPT